MKQIYGMAALLAVMAAGCSQKPKTTVEEDQQRVLQIDSVDTHSGVQRMKVMQTEADFKLGSRSLHAVIVREPDDDAPQVKSDVGTYVDNKVTLRLTRDGAAWVNRTLHKSDFAAHVSGESYASHFLFEGMVYDEERTAAEHLPVFAASISVPMTDLYIPFIVRVSNGGEISISRDEDMDVLPEIEE
jgi:hypothetical protein